MEKLVEVMNIIVNEQTLPEKFDNHPLHGTWEGSFDCHIQGNWVLIYKPNQEKGTVTFHRTGSHADLF